ncbi:MAG: hypothetical protein D6704_04240 [Nitrospirae bacterium]|nr:MAG: hypothetical protein D6704_04240 [Nitrospirota bacterium]
MTRRLTVMLPSRSVTRFLVWGIAASAWVACTTVPSTGDSLQGKSKAQNAHAQTSLLREEPDNPLESRKPPAAETTAPETQSPSEPAASPGFSLEERMAGLNPSDDSRFESLEPEPVYSFRAVDMEISDALRLFAQAYGLNIVVAPDVTGPVTVEFTDLPLEKAMTALLETYGYYWVKDKGLIRVQRLETRSFDLNYIRLVRGGTGSNKAQVTSGSGQTGGGGGGGSQDTGAITLSQQDEIKFWEELEEQIKGLMSEDGRLVINRLSGTIQVTDVHRRVEEIARFLARVRRSLYRQVEIEVRIYEVTLRDDYSLGIDWNRINFKGTAGNILLSNIITSPIGGIVARPATVELSFRDGSFDGVLKALSEQGDVRVVSQPRLLTLNNQPALIKVGTDQSFFISTVTQGVGGSGNIVTEQVRTVTSGLVLSVTPQISDDGWIMMDISPIITRLTDTVTSPNGSTAPILDVKQSGGLVRLRDGQIVVIGGLIQDQISETERKVPILGDIPYIGRLFRGTFQSKSKTELVIFLSPRIVRMG